jgi:hypothetical protein
MHQQMCCMLYGMCCRREVLQSAAMVHTARLCCCSLLLVVAQLPFAGFSIGVSIIVYVYRWLHQAAVCSCSAQVCAAECACLSIVGHTGRQG